MSKQEAIERENKALREGIQKFLDGDYPSARSYRPHKCPHDVYYWQDCGQCDDEYFERLLSGQEKDNDEL